MAPPPLAEMTARAQTLTSAGDLVGARQVLATALDPADAGDPGGATADLALAAALHARILIALGDPQAARQWAAYAQAAEERLHGPRHERTVAAAATQAAVLQRTGEHGRAAHLYRGLVRDLAELDGPDSPRVLAAEADLATAEHAAGYCTAARARLASAWQRHRDRHGDAAAAGIKMLARLGAMERECGREAEAREHLAQAQELCARYLPSDHPLVRQVTALAVAEPGGRHTCGRVEPPARASAGAPPVPFPRRPPVPESGFPPDDSPTDPNGTVYQQPLYLADVHQAPGDLTGRHARADTPPPGTEPRLPVRTEQPAAPPRRRQPFVLAAVLVAGIAAAVAVVALTLPDDDGAATPPAAAPSSAAPSAVATSAAPSAAASPAPAAAPGAPQNLRLRDNRDSVLLQWTYPKNSEGPVLVSGGRADQDQRVFQQLPAGSSDYVVYGLNENLNYCFTVAVAYSSANIAKSAPVCTKR